MPHAHFCAVFMGRPNKFPAVFRLLFVCLWLALMLQGIGNANETLSCYPTSSDDGSGITMAEGILEIVGSVLIPFHATVIPCAVVFGVVGVIEVFDALNKPSESDKAKAFNKCMQEYVQGVVDAAITDLYNHEISQLMDSYYIAGHDVVTLANSSSFSMATKRDELRDKLNPVAASLQALYEKYTDPCDSCGIDRYTLLIPMSAFAATQYFPYYLNMFEIYFDLYGYNPQDPENIKLRDEFTFEHLTDAFTNKLSPKFYEFWFSGKDTRLAKISLSTTTETYPCTAYSGANDPKIYKKHVIRDDVGLDNMIVWPDSPDVIGRGYKPGSYSCCCFDINEDSLKDNFDKLFQVLKDRAGNQYDIRAYQASGGLVWPAMIPNATAKVIDYKIVSYIIPRSYGCFSNDPYCPTARDPSNLPPGQPGVDFNISGIYVSAGDWLDGITVCYKLYNGQQDVCKSLGNQNMNGKLEGLDKDPIVQTVVMSNDPNPFFDLRDRAVHFLQLISFKTKGERVSSFGSDNRQHYKLDDDFSSEKGQVFLCGLGFHTDGLRVHGVSPTWCSKENYLEPKSCPRVAGYLWYSGRDHVFDDIKCFQVGEKMTLETMKAKCDEDKTCNSFSFGYIMGQSCLKTSSTPPTFPSFNCFYVKSPEGSKKIAPPSKPLRSKKNLGKKKKLATKRSRP